MKQEDEKNTAIRILSATYGPSDKRMLINGEKASSEYSRAPYTRDVLPFMKSLLSLKTGVINNYKLSTNTINSFKAEGTIDQLFSSKKYFSMTEKHCVPPNNPGFQRKREVNIQGDGLIYRNQNSVTLMEGKSMNAIFGDPCPGTTKKLTVSYIFYDEGDANSLRNSDVCRSTFVEYETVILKRHVKGFEVEGKSNSIDNLSNTINVKSNENFSVEETDFLPLKGSWKLPPRVSEIVIPIFLPFLEIKERVECQLVCKVWRVVVRNLGLAHTVDVDDPSFINFTRSFLRGLISQSYSSLHSLFLNDFNQLNPNDLHPALPHLRKLQTLDISRCMQLGDLTLLMISENLCNTLQVLYMKKLPKVTDVGLTGICRKCRLLRVLEISNLNISDNGGREIGNLLKLEALYMKDNFFLTNKSIDVITKKCNMLTQLTLWGCNKVSYISNETYMSIASELCTNYDKRCSKIVLLNLWGCLGLRDDCAYSIIHLQNLRTLVVSECLRLSDAFVVIICENMSQLRHIHLRYLRKITDVSISEIANKIVHLYSIDLSFCTKISLNAISYLIESRVETLAELRLYQCCQIDLTVPFDHNSHLQLHDILNGGDGRKLVQALQLGGRNSALNTLDVRGCEGDPSRNHERKEDERFLNAMAAMNFSQKVPSFFIRPARWNPRVKARLEEDMRDKMSLKY